MTPWVSILIKIILSLVFCLATAVVITVGPRLYTIANPPMNHTLFWVGDRQSRLSSLIENGADVNAPTSEGRTPLHLASQWGHVEHLSQLIDAGADVTARDHLGQRVLHFAANGGTAENVRFLLNHGANANASDNFRVSVLHRAASLGASFSSHGESLKLLIAAGAELDARTLAGDTVLHWAATAYYLEQTLLPLLKAGADPNRTNHQGESPLHIACKVGDEAAVLMLLDHGAQASMRNNKGHTPVDDAFSRNRPLTMSTLARLKNMANN